MLTLRTNVLPPPYYTLPTSMRCGPNHTHWGNRAYNRHTRQVQIQTTINQQTPTEDQSGEGALRMSGIDINELKRQLAEKKTDSHDDPFTKMEHEPAPGKARTRREIRTADGETIYVEEREITVNPYSAQQEHTIVQISHRCESCQLPITGEMFSLDLIKPCVSCQKKTCPRCRINTNLHEYLKPEIRGQALCQSCWDRHAHTLVVTCPNCKQPVKDYYDVKRCSHCDLKVCPACGVPLPGGALICGSCFTEREAHLEAREVANAIFSDALGRSY